MKPLFLNDYSETAHPNCLNALLDSPLKQELGYGNDCISEQAKKLILKQCAQPNAHIHFLSGGTQTNLTLISAALRPYEAVIAPDTGHIYANETGAIEATGHKVISIPHQHGKIYPDTIYPVFEQLIGEHTLRPKMLYISQSTELGTIYTLGELQRLRQLCNELNLYLYIDGARIGSALMSHECDWNLADIAHIADAFYIGGTKNGALLGEALLISHPDIQSHFRYILKQRGALLAKGRIIGSQFLSLFTPYNTHHTLFEHCALHANNCAQHIQNALLKKGYAMWHNSTTNQIFPILPNTLINQLQHNYGFYIWKPIDNTHSIIRLVTSWATATQHIEQLIQDIPDLPK